MDPVVEQKRARERAKKERQRRKAGVEPRKLLVSDEEKLISRSAAVRKYEDQKKAARAAALNVAEGESIRSAAAKAREKAKWIERAPERARPDEKEAKKNAASNAIRQNYLNSVQRRKAKQEARVSTTHEETGATPDDILSDWTV